MSGLKTKPVRAGASAFRKPGPPGPLGRTEWVHSARPCHPPQTSLAGPRGLNSLKGLRGSILLLYMYILHFPIWRSFSDLRKWKERWRYDKRSKQRELLLKRFKALWQIVSQTWASFGPLTFLSLPELLVMVLCLLYRFLKLFSINSLHLFSSHQSSVWKP